MLFDHGFTNTIHVRLDLGKGKTRLDAAQYFKPVAAAAFFAQIVGRKGCTKTNVKSTGSSGNVVPRRLRFENPAISNPG